MDPFASGAPDLAAAVQRVADRLRSLSDARLARPLPPHATRADAAHALAQQLADTCARLEGVPARPVPRLHDLAVGDQVAVTGHDLVAAAGGDCTTSDAGVASLVVAATAACHELAAAL
jgi:hypothetical protein